MKSSKRCYSFQAAGNCFQFLMPRTRSRGRSEISATGDREPFIEKASDGGELEGPYYNDRIIAI